MDTGVVGNVNFKRENFILSTSRVLDTPQSQDVLTHILGGRAGVDPPTAVRTNNPRRLSAMLIPQVLSNGLSTGHD